MDEFRDSGLSITKYTIWASRLDLHTDDGSSREIFVRVDDDGDVELIDAPHTRRGNIETWPTPIWDDVTDVRLFSRYNELIRASMPGYVEKLILAARRFAGD